MNRHNAYATTIPKPTHNQTAWFLLNQHTDSSTIKQLYKNANSPKILLWLYENTLLHSHKEQGAFLVDCSEQLLEDFCQQPNKWPGFLIYSQQTAQELIEHFRKMLVVRFYQEEKGVLNYLDLRVANFLFKMPQEQLNTWLGPVDALYWYGGDFIDIATNQQTLHSVVNLSPLHERASLPTEPWLTVEQTALLESCQQQQSISEWSTNTNTPFLKGWQYYQEAQALSFTDKQINAYMQLRSQHPTARLPSQWAEHITAQQKLHQLKEIWNNID